MKLTPSDNDETLHESVPGANGMHGVYMLPLGAVIVNKEEVLSPTHWNFDLLPTGDIVPKWGRGVTILFVQPRSYPLSLCRDASAVSQDRHISSPIPVPHSFSDIAD